MKVSRALSFFILVASSANCLAFDTGHHHDLTRDALLDFGMSDNAIKVCQVENWLVDYYSNREVGVDDHIMHDCAKLHADNLFTERAVMNYWRRYAFNAKAAFESAARSRNSKQVLALLGMSLHTVQDFYSHSNWPELQPVPAGSNYATATIFDAPSYAGVYTGKTSSSTSTEDRPTHGNYEGGINHDSYVRRNWDKAYVFAYSASRQWINQVKLWVSAIDSGTWSKACQISLTSSQVSRLNSDLHAAYRMSEWVKWDGDDGHWKGKGSGDSSSFIAFSAAWIAGTRDSIFVEDFKNRNWQKLLSGGQNGSLDLGVDAAPPRIVPITRFELKKKAVVVRTILIKDLNDQDWPVGQADMYAKITVGGQAFVEATMQDKNNPGTHWTTMKFFDASTTTTRIRYEMWEEDTAYDDHMDVNSSSDFKDLDLLYNLSTHRLSGTGITDGVYDTSARFLTTNGNPGARITITVTTKSLAPTVMRPVQKPIQLSGRSTRGGG